MALGTRWFALPRYTARCAAGNVRDQLDDVSQGLRHGGVGNLCDDVEVAEMEDLRLNVVELPVHDKVVGQYPHNWRRSEPDVLCETEIMLRIVGVHNAGRDKQNANNYR